MEFNEEILTGIILAGQAGKPIAIIARDLGLTSNQLVDECKKNPELAEAIRLAEFNFKQIMKAKIYTDILQNKPVSQAAKELLFTLIEEEKSDKNTTEKFDITKIYDPNKTT